AVLTLVPHGVPVPRTKLRLARPILSSVSIVTACGALASVAVLGDSKAIGSLQSTLLIVLLGGGIAARVVANQVASTQAHQTVEEALTRRETALREADLALERVRETNETIRSLFQFLQDRDEDRTRLLRRTNSAIEQERNRIARDLHDGPVQGVSAASLSLEAALLMIKTGDVDRGLDVLTKIRQELAEE